MSAAGSVLVEKVVSGRPVGVGIVGLGAVGSWAEYSHKPALAAVDGYELRALSASSSASAARSGEMHGVARTFGSAVELAACDEVDLVVVAVKVPHHHELVTAALEAGKAVLCEWPLGNGLAEAEDLAGLARRKSLPSVVGLQARSNPALAYARELVADGYVGEVLSTTMVGSGASWGATVEERNRYLLDPVNGATLRTIPFGHALDGLAFVLGEPTELRVEEVVRRTEAVVVGTGERVPASAPDQVVATGRLPGGAVVAVHYRGGTFPGTNFRWEINGTEGDLVLTAPSGHVQLSPVEVTGGRRGDGGLTPLPVPARHIAVPGLDPVQDAPAYAVAHAYHHFLAGLREGATTVPDFAHAVMRHRSIG